MPIPQPNQGEHEEQFVQRCMADDKMASEYPDESQRYAVCIAQVGNQVLNQESYTDYPQAASDNAERALRLRDEYPKDCGTPVGWTRANQLANKEPISRETIARMAAFERHRDNSTGDPKEDCGARMWLAWGGDEGIEWAQRKLEQIDRQNFKKLQILKAMMQVIEDEIDNFTDELQTNGISS